MENYEKSIKNANRGRKSSENCVARRLFLHFLSQRKKWRDWLISLIVLILLFSKSLIVGFPNKRAKFIHYNYFAGSKSLRFSPRCFPIYLLKIWFLEKRCLLPLFLIQKGFFLALRRQPPSLWNLTFSLFSLDLKSLQKGFARVFSGCGW